MTMWRALLQKFLKAILNSFDLSTYMTGLSAPLIVTSKERMDCNAIGTWLGPSEGAGNADINAGK